MSVTVVQCISNVSCDFNYASTHEDKVDPVKAPPEDAVSAARCSVCAKTEIMSDNEGEIIVVTATLASEEFMPYFNMHELSGGAGSLPEAYRSPTENIRADST
ncbi:hypothetical protein J6590_021504 [Homalodisca vitripennis]|nr:hypothetical protein J6590_021504 [Homalodisca vitripennis]